MFTTKAISILKFAPFYFLSLFPLFILHIFSGISAAILYGIIKYRRKVVLDNLQKTFPEKGLKELQKIEKRFYRHFCDIFIEALKTLTIRKSSIIKRYKLKNPDLVSRYFQEGKSLILYSGHYGNWEWMSSLPFHIHHQMLSFYQDQSNKYFDQLMLLIRERFGNKCVESKTGYKILSEYARNKQLTLTLIIGDQSPNKSSSKHWVPFLNRETAFLIGADRIAKKLGHTLLFPKMTKVKRGFYEFEFLEMEAYKNSDNVIDSFAKLLEENIKEQPEMWLWSHRRWKLVKE